MYRSTPLPRDLAVRELRVVRPRDASHIYRNPSLEFTRLTRAGLLVKVARGYYAIPPREALGLARWRPTPESVALGIALTDYPIDQVALAGISAARQVGVPPRALALGVVVVPSERRAIDTIAGTIHFWSRDAMTLDLQRAKTDLAVGWMTTIEQTLLDLADRPDVGDVSSSTYSEALWQLAPQVDWKGVHELSVRQRRRAAYTRARWATAGLADGDAPPARPSQRLVASKGLTSWSDADPASYGVTP